VSPLLGADGADALAGAVARLDRLGDVRELTRLLAADEAAS
jgi:hypothetical protein